MIKFSVAAVFSNHMVLQRGKNISVFGTAQDGDVICVCLVNERKDILSGSKATAHNGRWMVQLEPQVAQENCTLMVCPEKNKKALIMFEDVAIGEVWLAGGQSNMEFELQNCTEGPEALNEEAVPNVRFYYTNKIAWQDEHFYVAERNTCWQTWQSDGKKAWSAVGYFFAKKLAADLGCVVGIVGCNWGGTSASAWMRKEYLQKDEDLITYLTEYEEATAGKSIEQQCKEYDDYEIENTRWQERYSLLWQRNHNITWEEAEKTLGKNPWPGPKSCKNPYRPTGLYDCMLSRILPYTMKGVLWYQGESDDHKPEMYYKLFTNMIDNWRTDWHDNLPFMIVQLPVHRYEADKDFKNWCLIREAQAKTHETIKNVWMTCALDLGQYSDIHPKAKKVLAERMEMNALANIYHQISSDKVLSPMLKDSLTACDKIVLSFSNCEDGFDYVEDKVRLEELKKMEERQGTPLAYNFTGFEVAGVDGVFYPAKFEFGSQKGKLNTITLCSNMVAEPVSARYAWFNYGPVTIYSKNGLPLAPFRTAQK